MNSTSVVPFCRALRRLVRFSFRRIHELEVARLDPKPLHIRAARPKRVEVNPYHLSVVSLFLLLCPTSFAQDASLGTIEGRVQNPATGEYVESVRITVEGTALETFTDAAGQFRLTNVPPGNATVRAFHTAGTVAIVIDG